MIENLKIYRENKFFYPLNLLLNSIGKISAVIGFQFGAKLRDTKLILRERLNILLLEFYCSVYAAVLFRAMIVSRIYFEFILWLAISIIFINSKKEKFNFYTKIIVALPESELVLEQGSIALITVLICLA